MTDTVTELPVEGEMAPDFTLSTDSGEPLSLASLRGRAVVLYFYPKDDTDGCTRESCEFRDLFPRFRRAKAEVLGISPDGVRSHQRFKAKYALPFTLLADVGAEVAKRYGVWQEKQLFGRRYMGVVRTTFLIAPDGRIARVFPKVSPDGHAAEVASAVRALG